MNKGLVLAKMEEMAAAALTAIGGAKTWNDNLSPIIFFQSLYQAAFITFRQREKINILNHCFWAG